MWEGEIMYKWPIAVRLVGREAAGRVCRGNKMISEKASGAREGDASGLPRTPSY